MGSSSDATEAADGDASENKKKKKQKKKKKGKTEDDEEGANLKQDAPEDKQIHKTDKEAKKSTAKVARVRNFPNGLVIEDISMGKPDGRRASRGSKVTVYSWLSLVQRKNGFLFNLLLWICYSPTRSFEIYEWIHVLVHSSSHYVEFAFSEG